MEYLPGLSLAELVERYGPLPPARVVYLLRQVCGALREAHAAGLIHRDIKPSNIIAARRGGMDDVAKLLDFGLVRPAATARAAHLSAEGQILGTPLFMSPEQATGSRELDERSDIYSLGAVAYYLLTGRPPFEGEDGIAVLIAHARDPVVPPSQVRPGIPKDLERVVLVCLAKDAAERYPDAASLERALGDVRLRGELGPGSGRPVVAGLRPGPGPTRDSRLTGCGFPATDRSPARDGTTALSSGSDTRPLFAVCASAPFRRHHSPPASGFPSRSRLALQEDEMFFEMLRIALHHAAERNNAGSVVRTLPRERVV